MQHARLSPSSSSRWLTCTASVEVGDRYENTTNSSAEWGTNVHYMGEILLKGGDIAVGDVLQEERDKRPFTVDQEMLTCAEEYADYVNSFIDKNSVVLIEEKFDLSVISPNQFGTSDATVLNGTHLHVMDLKTGRGIVMAESNTQLMLYAIGAVEELEGIYDIDEITLHIVQTRAGHLDTWNLHYEDLMKFKAYAQKQAKDIIEDRITFNPTAKACQWCPHQTNCEALKQHVDDTMTGAFDNLEDIEGMVDVVDMKHLTSVLKNADLIIGFIKACQDRARELAEDGTEIEGFKLIRGRKNRKWADEAEVAKYLNRKIKSEDLWVKKLAPMTKLLKMRPKDKKLEAMLIRPEGDLKLVPLSDKGEAVTIVKDEFEDLS